MSLLKFKSLLKILLKKLYKLAFPIKKISFQKISKHDEKPKAKCFAQ